jgi:DNA recombination protein RmuC
MTFIGALLVFLCAAIAYVAWKITFSHGEHESSRQQRELIESLRKELQESRERDREHLQDRFDGMSKILTSGIQETSRQSVTIIRDVTEKLTKLDETNKQVVNFSAQLEDLQRILKQPKGKGVLGEYWLETMLSHVLQPDQYKMQYKFRNGELVDAVVFSQERIIPIDAKFSSEKYSRIANEKDPKDREKLEEEFKKDLKDRIDETAKYIRPEENTTDYAFMFIPAEGIYYDLLVQKVGVIEMNRMNLIKYAHEKRVLIVSPNTFFAFLQTVIEGMKAYKMQQSVQDILKNIHRLGKHMKSYDSFMRKVGSNLSTTVNMYDQAYEELRKVNKDVFKITNGEEGGETEPLMIEKPTAHLVG